MNNLRYNILVVLAIVLTSSFLSSCDDANDWDTDNAYNRLFRTSKLSVTPSATEVEATWNSVLNASYYVFELNTEPFEDDNFQEGSLIYGEDGSITSSPYTLEGLEGSTEYYLRMRAYSDIKLPSKWAYLDDETFSTRSEQIVQSVRTTSNTAIINWTPGVTINRIELLRGEDFLKDLEITDEIIREGTITIENLIASTTYTVNLYNGENRRGYANFQTAPDIPVADYTAILAATDSLNQDLFDDLAAAGYGNVTIVLPAGAVYNNINKLYLPDNMSLTFFGLPGASKPIIAVQMFEFGSVHGFIKFENIELSAYCTTETGSVTQHSYVFNQTNETNVGTLEFNDCFIHDFINSPVRLQGTPIKTIRELIINDCIIYGPYTTSYSIVHVDAGSGAGKIENITITNTTTLRSGKSFILSKDTDMQSITIQNCTFSKVPGNSNYLIDFNTAGTTGNIILENIILGSSGGESSKGVRYAKGTLNVIDSYATTDWVINGSRINDLIQYNGSETDLFENPEEGDFTIKDTSFAGRRDAGDPRWR